MSRSIIRQRWLRAVSVSVGISRFTPRASPAAHIAPTEHLAQCYRYPTASRGSHGSLTCRRNIIFAPRAPSQKQTPVVHLPTCCRYAGAMRCVIFYLASRYIHPERPWQRRWAFYISVFSWPEIDRTGHSRVPDTRTKGLCLFICYLF